MAEQTTKTAPAVAPRLTEKSYSEQINNTYAFFVKPSLTKQEIQKLIETEFSVTVTDVRTLTRKGKKTRFSRGRHAYPGTTYRRDPKLAYVTLKEGDSIKLTEDDNLPEENTKTDAKEAEAKDKSEAKADKNARKENK